MVAFMSKKRTFLCAVLALVLCICSFAACDHGDQGKESNDSKLISTTEDSSFYITFIDVGQADAALVMCDGEYMLIDGGNVDDSSRIYTMLKDKKVGKLKYIIGTHAHEDHIGGLAGALSYCDAEKVFCPVSEYDSTAFNNFKMAAQRRGRDLEMPTVGTTYSLGSATFTVLSPGKVYEDTNDSSIVIKLEYGDTSFLLTGDSGYESEGDMVAAGFDLSADLLKVGHHGSSSSTSYVFLREVMPRYAVISVGADNMYGHPHDEALSRLKDAGVTVMRTDELGDITCHSDGKELIFEYKDKTENSTVSAPDERKYIANINSGVLHRDTCRSLPSERNRVYFDTVEQAEKAGYTKHCQSCKP